MVAQSISRPWWLRPLKAPAAPRRSGSTSILGRGKRGTDKWCVYGAGSTGPDHAWLRELLHTGGCKHTLNKLAGFTWRRVVGWLTEIRRWKWKDVRRRLTIATGVWKPIGADGLKTFEMVPAPLTRYPYRGNTIPTPGTRRTTPDTRKGGEAAAER